MPRGGYQEPSNPAPVSGPGAMSARTDSSNQVIRDLPDPEYGAGKAFREQQQAAPLPGGAPIPSAPPPGGGAPTNPGASLIPLAAPSQRPEEPVTAGADAGPGFGSEALGLGQTRDPEYDGDLEYLRDRLPALLALAAHPNASPSARNYVRRVRGALPRR